MVQAFINNLLYKKGANVTLPALQMGEDGGIDQAKALEVENQTSPLTIGQRLFGRELTKDIQHTDPTTGETSMETIRSYRPGLLQNVANGLGDFKNGFNENLNNGFESGNWNYDKNKGWATRIGEGLGTATRFLDSPLGRGLLVGGIVGATGGNGLQALAYGGGATVGNQANRMKDKLYRNELIQSQKQALMNSPEFNALSSAEQQQILNSIMANNEGYDNLTDEQKEALYSNASQQYLTNRQQKALSDIENQVNSIRGYVTEDAFKNLVASQQMRDNYAWRKLQSDQLEAYRQAQLEANKKQQEFNNYMAKMNLEDKKEERRFRASEGEANRAVTMRGQDINANKQDKKAIMHEKQSMSTINTINTALRAVKNNPKAFGFAKGVMGADITNRLDKQGVQSRAIVESVTAEYRKYLTGAQMSDKERKAYEKFLPSPRDNAQIIENKLKGMLNVISAREGIEISGFSSYQGKPLKNGSTTSKGWAFQ